MANVMVFILETWQKKNIKTFVWRCRERLKSGSAQCKQSVTVKEADIDDGDITKQLLNMVIDRIVITDDGTATVHFKSGLIIEKTLT